MDFNRDSDINYFIGLMDQIGFELIKYTADIRHRSETEIPFDAPLIDYPGASDIYSACWYGGEFFKWLFHDTGILINVLESNQIYHGSFEGVPECHYFFIITTEDEAIILNTYGGIDYLIISRLSLASANIQLDLLRRNYIPAIEELFGVNPDYKKMNITVEITKAENRFPSREEISEKINELISNAYTEEDKVELYRLKTFI